MAKRSGQEDYDAGEAQRRTESALRAAFNTPHKTYEESKIGKRRAKPKASPGRRSPVKKSPR